MALELLLTGMIVLQLLMLAGLLVLFRRTTAGGLSLSEEEAEAEAYLTHTVERLLQDLQQSADRATAGLSAQRAALEVLVADATSIRPQAATRDWEQDPPVARAWGGANSNVWAQDARALAEEGLSAQEIARQMGRGEAEIRLALTAGAS